MQFKLQVDGFIIYQYFLLKFKFNLNTIKNYKQNKPT